MDLRTEGMIDPDDDDNSSLGDDDDDDEPDDVSESERVSVIIMKTVHFCSVLHVAHCLFCV